MIHRLSTKLWFDYIFIASTNPYTWWNVSRISRKNKVPNICKISCNYFNYMNWLIDTRRSKNIQKNVKFVWKIRIGQINKILRKKMSIMKRAKQPFYQFYMFKTHTHMQISYNSVVQACHDFKIMMHTSKREETNFKFMFIQCRFVR